MTINSFCLLRDVRCLSNYPWRGRPLDQRICQSLIILFDRDMQYIVVEVTWQVVIFLIASIYASHNVHD